MSDSNGGWEMWKRTPETSFVKIVEYLGGVTANYSQTPEYTSGMSWFKWMTTLNCDVWFYYDDFIMATSEADLPTYTTIPSDTTPPSPPTGVAVN